MVIKSSLKYNKKKDPFFMLRGSPTGNRTWSVFGYSGMILDLLSSQMLLYKCLTDRSNI